MHSLCESHLGVRNSVLTALESVGYINAVAKRAARHCVVYSLF